MVDWLATGAGVEERDGLDSMFKRFIPGAIGEDDAWTERLTRRRG